METNWSKPTKYIVGVGMVLLGIYILYLSRPIIPLLILAALIAVIVRPVILWLHQQAHLPRGLAVAVVYLGVLIIVPLALMLAIPAIVDALNYVVSVDYQSFIQGSVDWIRSRLISIRDAQLPIQSLDAYIDQLVDSILNDFLQVTPAAPPALPPVSEILQSIGSALTLTFGAAASLVGTVVTQAALLVFLFLASIYISMSVHTYRQAFLGAVPAPYRPEIDILLERIARMWTAFFRGELTLMLIIGVLSWLGLTALGVPGALSLAIITGLLELIPNLGPIIATIPALIVALLQGSTYLPVSNLVLALLVLLLYVLVQQLENNLIVPRVLGGAVELPPLVVMIGVLVGASVAGILGALLATPVIATGREILRYAFHKMQGEHPFPARQIVLEPGVSPSTRRLQSLRGWLQRLARSRSPASRKPPSGASATPGSDPDAEDYPPN